MIFIRSRFMKSSPAFAHALVSRSGVPEKSPKNVRNVDRGPRGNESRRVDGDRRSRWGIRRKYCRRRILTGGTRRYGRNGRLCRVRLEQSGLRRRARCNGNARNDTAGDTEIPIPNFDTNAPLGGHGSRNPGYDRLAIFIAGNSIARDRYTEMRISA